MFRTGDLAKYRLDGQIELLGRIDDQVKVNGFRVNLCEVEAVLASHPKVHAAVVAPLEQSDETRLVAYLVPEPDMQLSEIQKYAWSKLPAYALPSRFVLIDNVPLTATGKINRRGLPPPGPERPPLSVEFRTPSDGLERDILNLWTEALGMHDVGVDDDFLELGGDSLIAIRLAIRIQSRYGIAINLRDILTSPTVALLAEFVRNIKAARTSPESDLAEDETLSKNHDL